MKKLKIGNHLILMICIQKYLEKNGESKNWKFLGKCDMIKCGFWAFTMQAKNKPTFLQSQFLGQDYVGCFKDIK